MKPSFNHFFAASITTVIALSSSAFADTRIKQNNATALNLAGSWDTLPIATDIVQWDSTVKAANSTALGANLSWTGIKIINPTGQVTIGTAATNTVTLGASGIDLSSATQNLVINSSVTAGAAQTWQVTAGQTLQLQTINTNTRLSGTGDINLTNSTGTGTATFDFRPGANSSTGFTDQFGFYAYSGNWTINAGVFAKTLRNGQNAWGSGSITLNGGTIAQQQNFSGVWLNSITLQTGSNSTIDDANTSGTRSLKLQGVISSDGNLTIAETGTASYAINGGVILTATNLLSGQVTIATNGVLRIGGVTGATSIDQSAGTGGTLGTATVVNNGTLTLSHSDTWAFGNNITSGTGALTIGGVTGTLVIGGGTQVVTMSGANAYTGATTVGQGRLNLTGSLTSAVSVASGATVSGTGSTTGLLTMATGSNLALAGGATTTNLTTNGVTFSGPIVPTFDTAPILSTVYDILTYGAGTLTTPVNLSMPYRGTLLNTGSKFTFTAGEYGSTRTWNTTSGTWEIGGSSTNWAEGDFKFYNADNVIFGNIASDSAISLTGSLAPASVAVTNTTNTYTFAGPGALSGAMSLTKSGSGLLTISSNNTYSGATLINEGTLKWASGTNIATSVIAIASGAVFQWAPTVSNVNFAGPLTGTGKVLRSASAGANAVFSGDNSAFNGTWEVTGNYVGLATDASVGASTVGMTLNGGGIYFTTTGHTLAATRTITLGASGGFLNGGTGATNTFAAKFTGAGGLTKVSGETAILTGINDYTGNTAVNTGTLNLADNAQLKFVIGANSVNNQINGVGTVLLNGDFNLDLSGADTTSTNVWHLVNVTTLTETFGATFTLVGFTETANVHTMVAGPVTWTFTESSGDLTVAPSAGGDFDTWIGSFTFAPGADKTATGDPDGDGLNNQQEYAFGLDPSSGASVNPITVQLDKSVGTLTYTRRKPSLTGLTNYQIWTSPDLAVWTVDAGAGQVPTDIGNNQSVAVTLTGAPLTAPKLFVRVSAE